MSESHTDPEILARQLDRTLPPGKRSVPLSTPDPLINTAAQIAMLSTPVLPAEASRRIEAQMLAAFDAQYHPRSVTRSRRRTETTLRWGLVACLALVLLLVGITPAVAASLPGEPLYSVKRAYEKIEIAIATSPAAKADIYLQHADRRTQEALALLERNQFDAKLIAEAFSDVAAAGSAEQEIRASARLRGQLLQVETALAFIVQNAQQSGLIAQAEIAPLTQQLEQLGSSDLLLPPETPTPAPTAVPTHTDTPTEQTTATLQPTSTATMHSTHTPMPTPTAPATATPPPTQMSQAPSSTPPCSSPGNSCQSQGVPGGVVIPGTPQGNNGADNGGNGNGAENSNAGGNGNGNGAENSNAGGNSDGNGAENSNAGGNGNGNGGGNGGGNGNGNGGGNP